MERIIVRDMLFYLMSHKLISKQQHGFLCRKSTTTNLLETLNDWSLAINQKKGVAAAYIDYAKAFDTVCHDKLCHKLAAYGIAGTLLQWIGSFLSDRSMCTRVGSSLSSYCELSSGVIQGSVLGPLLFVLYINDIIDLFPDVSLCKMYADDVKLYTTLECENDSQLLQTMLDDVQRWSDLWQLNISYKKCNIIVLGNVKTSVDFVLNGNVIQKVESLRDLGVIVSCNLKFSDHINKIVCRAHARANLIHKCFVSRDTATLVFAFTTYVRPLLEYASCVWSPQTIGLIKKVESVQRRFTKRLPNMKHLSYDERLRELKLESLELRRLKTDLIYTYKIICGYVDVDISNLFCFNNNITRGHSYKLHVNYCRNDVRKNFFANRVIHIWNKLPLNENVFRNINVFKVLLNSYDFSAFLHCF
jgi:hypothetical protein